MTEQLKPCPFCGRQPKRVSTSFSERFAYAQEVSYVCSCGCRRSARGDTSKGGYADNSKVEENALAAWNTRALTTSQPAQAGEACAHRWCNFGGQQPRRRCIDCNTLEPSAQTDRLPEIGSVWQHTNGNHYTVLHIANEFTQDPTRCPQMVVYQGTANALVWARAASDWQHSMTRVDTPQQTAPATPEDMKVYDGIAADYFAETQQATPDVPETDFGNMATQQATPEPVGEVDQIDIDEDGRAHAWVVLHDNVTIGAKLYDRPAPGVPEGWAIEWRPDFSPTALVVRSPKDGPGFITVENNHANIAYRMLYCLASDLLAAAQAKGADPEDLAAAGVMLMGRRADHA